MTQTSLPATVVVERIFGNGYATSCSGVTNAGTNCKRNTFWTYNGRPLCGSHTEQATAMERSMTEAEMDDLAAWLDRQGNR
jgi:hypothetical protein